ncbi:MAG TPA: DUF167 domain-containing protein [Deltaproteobacteria bacterium]|nr:DUF167 domain-containing protein [Deltaproteobacteria bacterium]
MWIRSRGEETILTCRVHPNAPQNRIEKVQDDQLVVRLNSPPVEGKANKALLKLLAKTLHVAPSRLTLIQGDKSRTKVIAIQDITPEQVLDILDLPDNEE